MTNADADQHLSVKRDNFKGYRFRLPPLTLLALIIEFAILILAALYATQQYNNTDPGVELGGIEAEFLTSSANLEYQSLHQEGFISLWSPWVARGEPAVDGPFSFVLNPISSAPTLLYGVPNGIKLSIILSVIVAGLGGWALGRVMGLGALGRIVLGLLCIGKGNMHTIIQAGFYQLGVNQAYMAWVAAGALGVLRFKSGRWAPVLLAVSFTLLFWGGTVYYTLPSLVMVVLLMLSHVLHLRRDNVATTAEDLERKGNRTRWQILVDWAAVQRMILAGVLTLGLTAITFLPLFINQHYIGDHPSITDAGTYADPGTVIKQYFTSDQLAPPGTFQEEYYSFVFPFWFAVLIFVVFPPIYPWLHLPPNPRREWRIWAVGVFILIFFTLWGSGVNPVMGWLNANVPFVGQLRIVETMLAFSAFWLAILVAMRVDGLWRGLMTLYKKDVKPTKWLARFTRLRVAYAICMVALIIASLAASAEVIDTWHLFGGTGDESALPVQCITWLRQANPTKELTLWSNGFSLVTPFVLNRVRLSEYNSDYHPMGLTPTLFQPDLRDTPAEYALVLDDSGRQALKANGYDPVLDSPKVDGTNSCLWQNPDTLKYAFSIPLASLRSQPDTLPPGTTTPITRLERHLDRIALLADGSASEPIVVVVQEVAWPGWFVQVDGQPAKLESIGQLIGVVLPPGATTHYIYFQYKPPLLMIGGIITLLTFLICVAFLLKLDRFVPQRWVQSSENGLRNALARIVKTLLDPRLLGANEDQA